MSGILKNPGYVYALINPSVEGLVKIGKTAKDPEERAKELSAATGVATPFIVVYKAFFQDCDNAETFVHTLLNNKRLSDNKEFFRASPMEVINAIVQAERKFGVDTAGISLENNSSAAAGLSEEVEDLCQDILDTGDAYLDGDGDKLQDYEEALKLYKQAAKLGCILAYRKIGDVYSIDLYIKGNPDIKKALYYYKEGALHGDDMCWGKMAICYSEMHEYGNSDKCWFKFVSSTSMNFKDSEMTYFIYKFMKYMDGSEFYPHDSTLEGIYQEIKKRGAWK